MFHTRGFPDRRRRCRQIHRGLMDRDIEVLLYCPPTICCFTPKWRRACRTDPSDPSFLFALAPISSCRCSRRRSSLSRASARRLRSRFAGAHGRAPARAGNARKLFPASPANPPIPLCVPKGLSRRVTGQFRVPPSWEKYLLHGGFLGILNQENWRSRQDSNLQPAE